MALPILGIALAVRFIHLDQVTQSTARFPPTPAELQFVALAGLDRVAPADLRAAGVVVSSLTAVLVQRLGLALVGPATGLYAGLWMALWWPAVALSAHLVPATLLAFALALGLLGIVAGVESKRPVAALAAGLGAGMAVRLDPAALLLVPGALLAFVLHHKWKRSTKVVAVLLLLGGVGVSLVGLNLLSGGRAAEGRFGLSGAVTPAAPADAAVRTPEAMAEDPWGFAVALGARAGRLAGWAEPAGTVDIGSERVRSWALRLPFPAWEVALPLALLGIVLTLRARKSRPGARTLAAITALLLLLALRAPVSAESRLPLVPALVPLALLGIGSAWARLRAGGFTLPGRRRAAPKR